MEHAATALRLLAPRALVLGTGDEDSLQNVNTTELPNGSLCWVNQNATFYRFDRPSVAASAPTAVIVPGSGPGRWVALAGGALLSEARMSMYRGDDATVAITDANVWQALPVEVANVYFPQVSGAAFWSIAGTSGIATYSGPDQIYHFVAALNAIVLDEVTVEVDVALTVNGADIGTNNARALAQRIQVPNDDYRLVTLANELSLGTGDTVQLMVRNATSVDDLLLAGIQIIGIPVGVAPVIT